MDGMNKTIVVMGGSFNPPTIAHARLLLGAVSEMRADRGIFVPSPDGYVCAKMRRINRSGEILPKQLRLRMLEAMAQDDPRLTVDDLEYRRTGRSYTYETMLALQGKYPGATLHFLLGGDKMKIFPKWYRSDAFLERFHLIIARRAGEDLEAVLDESEFLRLRRDRLRIIDTPEGIEDVSSSAVRRMLREGLPGAERMCHPGVWKLLMEHMENTARAAVTTP